MSNNSSYKFISNKTKPDKKNINFLIKFFWHLAGANIKVLEKAQANQTEYTMMGMGSCIRAILGMFSGGYGIDT